MCVCVCTGHIQECNMLIKHAVFPLWNGSNVDARNRCEILQVCHPGLLWRLAKDSSIHATILHTEWWHWKNHQHNWMMQTTIWSSTRPLISPAVTIGESMLWSSEQLDLIYIVCNTSIIFVLNLIIHRTWTATSTGGRYVHNRLHLNQTDHNIW